MIRRRQTALALLLALAACGGGGGSVTNLGDGGAETAGGGGSSGGNEAPLGETGGTSGGVESGGTPVGSGDYRPTALPTGATDPSFIITAKVSASAAAATVSGTATKDGGPAASAIVTATLTREEGSGDLSKTLIAKATGTPTAVDTQVTITGSNGEYALAFASPKHKDAIYVGAALPELGLVSNTVKLEIDIFGKVDELGNPLFGVGGANNIGPATLNGPADLVLATIPQSGKRLLVADWGNNRVMGFDLNSKTRRFAQGVLCQANFVTAEPGDSTTQCYAPHALAYDAVGTRLFVADRLGVHVFDLPSGFKSGSAAQMILGYGCTDPRQSFGGRPGGIAHDDAGQKLFVTDPVRNRVLIFQTNSPSSCSSATHILGQPNFTTSNSGGGSNGLNNPTDVAWDATTKRLYVLDAGNHRILVYNLTGSVPEAGLEPSLVIGRTSLATTADWWSEGLDPSQTVAGHVLSLSDDGATLYVGESFWDTTNGEYAAIKQFRVGPSLSNTPRADLCLGRQSNSCITNPATGPESRLRGAYFGGYVTDPETGDLYATDAANNRILLFKQASLVAETLAQASDCYGQLKTDGTCDLTKLGANAVSQSSFNAPRDIALDEDHNRIFVADNGNARVLVFNGKRDAQGSLILDDRLADVVLGSVTGIRPPQPSGEPRELLNPYSLTYADGLLFVGDASLGRISVFEVDSSLDNGMKASFPIGVNAFPYSKTPQWFPLQMAIDCQGRTLFFYDPFAGQMMCVDLQEGGTSLRSRITTYKSAGTILPYTVETTHFSGWGGNAPFGFSRPDCTSFYYGTAVGQSYRVQVYQYSGGCSGFQSKGVYVDTTPDDPTDLVPTRDSAYLFMTSAYHNAITLAAISGLTASNPSTTPTNVIGQSSWTSRSPGVGEGQFSNPTAIACTSDDRYCYVADTGNNRGVVIKNPLCAGLAPPQSNCN